MGPVRAIEPDAPAAIALPTAVGLVPVSESGPRWSALTAQQRQVLAPLAEDWAGIDAARKQKWLEIALRYPSLSKAEQGRVQQRMAEWARLTPSQRGEVRLNFQQASRTAPAERQAQWQAYKALPQEEKSRLANRAAQSNRSAARPSSAAATAGAQRAGESPIARSGMKSNLVPNPLFTAAPRTVGPTIVRSGPGATTTLVTRQPAPPPHQMIGLPKVAATPVLVDQTTLLPQRGPQAASVVSPGAAAQAAAAGVAVAATVAPPAAAASAVAPGASAPSHAGPPYHDTSVGER
jgi:hypothetical protein